MDEEQFQALREWIEAMISLHAAHTEKNISLRWAEDNAETAEQIARAALVKD